MARGEKPAASKEKELEDIANEIEREEGDEGGDPGDEDKDGDTEDKAKTRKRRGMDDGERSGTKSVTGDEEPSKVTYINFDTLRQHQRSDVSAAVAPLTKALTTALRSIATLQRQVDEMTEVSKAIHKALEAGDLTKSTTATGKTAGAATVTAAATNAPITDGAAGVVEKSIASGVGDTINKAIGTGDATAADYAEVATLKRQAQEIQQRTQKAVPGFNSSVLSDIAGQRLTKAQVSALRDGVNSLIK